MPDDKDQLWTQAGQRLASGQRDDGRRFYRVFIQRFPPTRARRRPTSRSACRSCRRASTRTPPPSSRRCSTLSPSPEVPEAMWQLSQAFVELHFCTRRALLSDLMKRYPRSARAGDAKSELKSIAKLPKSACSS